MRKLKLNNKQAYRCYSSKTRVISCLFEGTYSCYYLHDNVQFTVLRSHGKLVVYLLLLTDGRTWFFHWSSQTPHKSRTEGSVVSKWDISYI